LVAEKIFKKHITFIWKEMSQNEGIAWYPFEILTRTLLTQAEGKKVVLNARPGKVAMVNSKKNPGKVSVGGCTSMCIGENNLVEDAKKRPGVLYHSSIVNHALFDFVNQDTLSGHIHVFQVAVGNSHKASVPKILDLEKQAGGHLKVSLYYLVPSYKYNEFYIKWINGKKESIQCEIWIVEIPKSKFDE
jgi:hypothetical protein